MKNDPMRLSRRERQIMEVVYARGQATATDVVAGIDDPPGRTSVRTMMRILEVKGHLTHTVSGKEYVYRPSRPRAQVARSALRRLLETFFGGSLEKAVAAHLADPRAELSPAERRRLQGFIDRARKGDA